MMRPGDLTDLPNRDLHILGDLRRVRLLTGRHLERLHFHSLNNPNTRGSARRRSLQRLEQLHFVTSLERRVGGERAGSAGLVYALDTLGRRLVDEQPRGGGRRRRPWPIGQLFVTHTLAISELYVRLREAERAGHLQLLDFQAEPDAWYESSLGLVKPDAFAVVATGRYEDHFWLEVDRGTESLPTLRRKLLVYVDVALAGDGGPAGVLPQVLVTTESERRRAAVVELLNNLPSPADRLIRVAPFESVFRDGLAANRGPP